MHLAARACNVEVTYNALQGVTYIITVMLIQLDLICVLILKAGHKVTYFGLYEPSQHHLEVGIILFGRNNISVKN